MLLEESCGEGEESEDCGAGGGQGLDEVDDPGAKAVPCRDKGRLQGSEGAIELVYSDKQEQERDSRCGGRRQQLTFDVTRVE